MILKKAFCFRGDQGGENKREDRCQHDFPIPAGHKAGVADRIGRQAQTDNGDHRTDDNRRKQLVNPVLANETDRIETTT